MRVLAFSDLHLDVAAAEVIVAQRDDVDLILGVGDFAQGHDGLAAYMELLEPLAQKAIYVPGNNETETALRAATSATVLHGDSVDVGGLTISGLGCAVPPLPSMPWGSFDLSEDEAAAKLDGIASADILLSHSPPFGVADVLAGRGAIGSVAVRAATERLQPRYLLCGHVHDCWGQDGQIGRTTVRNLGPAGFLFEVTS